MFEKIAKIMDGKKTITGLSLLLVSLFFSEKISAEDATIIIDEFFAILGSVLTIIGVIHKLLKLRK